MSTVILATMLTHRAKIRSVSRTIGANKLPIISFGAFGSEVNCRVSEIDVEQLMGAAGMVYEATHQITFKGTESLVESQEVDVTSPSVYAGRYVLVKVLPSYDESSLHHYECLAKKRQATFAD